MASLLLNMVLGCSDRFAPLMVRWPSASYPAHGQDGTKDTDESIDLRAYVYFILCVVYCYRVIVDLSWCIMIGPLFRWFASCAGSKQLSRLVNACVFTVSV